MKRFLKKLSLILLVMSLALTSVPAVANALPIQMGRFTPLERITVTFPNPMDADQQIRTVRLEPDSMEMLPFAEEEEYLSDIQEAAAVVREGMKNRENVVSVFYQIPASQDVVEDAVYPIWEGTFIHTGDPTAGDYLLWQWETYSVNIGGYTDGVNNYYTLEFHVTYYSNHEQEAQVDAAVAELLGSLELDGKTDYEKLCAVYDWMCANITYDYDHLQDPNYMLMYTAYAALIDRTSVCQGYAVLLYRLMLEQGIDCRVVTGDAGGPHAWNIVELDGKYYNLDATWDATYHQAGLEYNYFLRSNATFEDHARDAEFETEAFNTAYPMSEADYAPPAVSNSGDCGENLTWTLYDDGTLVISGTGPMNDYFYDFNYRKYTTPWYFNLKDISSVIIQDGVTSIGSYAFAGSYNMSHIYIADSVTTIGQEAFSSCAGLTEITIPDGVTTIQRATFENCEKLEKITLHQNITSIGEDAFAYSGLTSIEIPGSVTTIGEMAFNGCANLTSVKILGGDIRFGSSVFGNCVSLTDVEIGDGVIDIGSSTFSECSSLTTISLAQSVTTIGGGAFYGCSSLQSIVIPESVTTIGGNAFSNSGLTSIVIPDSVTTLGGGAFRYCNSLINATVGRGVTILEDMTFFACENLTNVEINCETIGKQAFSHCDRLTNISMGDRVTTIGENAFYGCASLLKIEIPSSLTTVGYQAFADCNGLTGVYISDVAAWCGIDFNNGDVYANPLYYAHNLYLNNELVTDLVIPDGVTYIANVAFSCCTSMSSVAMGKDVSVVGRNAFSGCTNLEAVHISDLAAWCAIQYRVEYPMGTGITNPLYYAHNLYLNNELVTDLVIPEDVSIINEKAFAYCTSLTGLTISKGVTSIGNQAFYDCTNLATVTFPSTLTSIGTWAFDNCTSLTKLEIPMGVTEINRSAFRNCTNLTVVILPATLTSLDSLAFLGCTNLWHVLYQGTETQWEAISGAFSEMPNVICHCDCTGEETVDPANQTCEICERGGEPECEHTWDEGVVTLAPGCETVGEKTCTCTKCGETCTEEVAATGHVSTHVENAQPATCGSGGYTGDIVCDTCGVTVEYGIVTDATGMHEYTSQVLAEPTCETDGEVRYTCVLCGDSYVEAIAASGHSYEETKVWPTCTEEGSITYTCSVCGHSYTESIPAKNHPYAWIINVVEVTCVTDGYTGDEVCADCGILLSTGEVIPATGHSFNGWVITTEPTATTEGYEEHTCWLCGMTEGRIIPALGAGEYEEGTLLFRIDGIAYLYGADGQLVATYTGWMTEIYEIEDDYDITAGGYMNTTPWFFDSYAVTNVIIEDGVAPVSTDFWFDCFENLTSITIPGSVTGIGYYTFRGCSSLSEIWFKGDAPTFHEESFDENPYWYESLTAYYPAGNATWTEVVKRSYGRTITWVAYGDDTPSCENGHSYESVVTAPTCSEDGYTTYICAVCGDTYTESIPALPHTPGAEATCTTDQICTICYYVLTPATGHRFGDWETITEPTETEEGYETRTCQICGISDDRSIPALGSEEYAQGTLVFCTDGIAYLYGAGGVVEETFTGWMTEIYEMQNDYENDMMFITSPWYFYRDNITCVIIEDGVSPVSTTLWFFSCRNLTSVSIGDGVTAIGNDAFFGCISLTSIAIPGTVTSIGSFAFSDSVKLSEITFEGDAPSIGEYAFKDVTATAYYPAGNKTWTEAVKQSYMGNITWIAYGDASPECSVNGHSYETVVTAPTCTESGYTTYTCTVCGDSYIGDSVVALGHDLGEWNVIRQPTCTEKGEEQQKCSRCDYSESREVAELGHNYTSVVTAPTCTEKGYTTHSCTNCGATYISDEVAALGHSWDDGVITREPTVEAEGEKTYTCALCGETRTEVLPKKEPVIYDTPADDSVQIPENDCFEGGTTVTVEKVEEGEIFDQVTESMENRAESYTVFEFTASKDGAPVQPNGKLTVSFTIPAEYSTNVALYYMDANGKLTKLEIVIDAEARTITVELEHFSTYILTDEDTAPSLILGDVNGDGKVNARDARLILRYAASLIGQDELDTVAGDYNGDGKVNARDARMVLRAAAGLD